jgi:hypothetical protein
MVSAEQPSRESLAPSRGTAGRLRAGPRQEARRDPGARPLVFADPVFDPAERARALAELPDHRLEFVGRVEQRGLILSAV